MRSKNCWIARTAWAIAFVLIGTTIASSQETRTPPASSEQGKPAAEANHASSGKRNGVPIDLASLERRLQAAYKRVSPAVVQILYGENQWYYGTGVIVSAEGHILASSSDARRVVDDKLLKIRLPDGRLLDGTALGWSSEWTVGLLKVNESAALPFVELGSGKDVAAGDLCMAVGYQRLPGGVEVSKQPELLLGAVTNSSGSEWFERTCNMVAGGYSMFSPDGKVIGVTTGVGRRATHTNVEKIKVLWDELITEDNVGLVRIKQFSKEDPGEGGGGDTIKTSDPGLPTFEQEVIEKAKLATVKIGKRAFSGVIVSEDGYIITCAHHRLRPTDKVIVSLVDGREANAVVLGSNWILDAGLIKITDEGSWPHVSLGNSFALKPGDRCFQIGYPVTKEGQTLTIVESEIAQRIDYKEVRESESAVNLYTIGSEKMVGGSSGGGLFDARGNVVGVILQNNRVRQIFLRAELFRKHWDSLLVVSADRTIDDPKGDPLEHLYDALQTTVEPLRSSTIQVLCDGKQRVVGTVVGSDGLVLTKLSELYGTLSCKLVDGRVFPATILRESPEHDLAILKIDADGLPEMRWSDDKDLKPGTLVAVVLPGKHKKAGVISLASRRSPSEPGWLGVDLEVGKGGVLVRSDRNDSKTIPLRADDIILGINDRSIVELAGQDDLNKVLVNLGSVGEKIQVTVRRKETEHAFEYLLQPSHTDTYKHVSSRWWNFPHVAGADIELAPLQCGCPLVDKDGRVVGIHIACRSDFFGWGLRHVLPAHIVAQFVEEAKAQAGD